MNPWHSDDLPSRCGVMILPWVSLFPGALLPLYIFEPRYRTMLADALSDHRLIALAHADDQGSVSCIGSLGVIRACVTNEDGTSHLILQGISRVRFEALDFSPYPQAELSVYSDDSSLSHTDAALREQLQDICRKIVETAGNIPSEFHAYLDKEVPIGFLADVVASALVPDPLQKRQLLEVIDPEERVVRLVDILNPNI